jgi:hypothetical protein
MFSSNGALRDHCMSGTILECTLLPEQRMFTKYMQLNLMFGEHFNVMSIAVNKFSLECMMVVDGLLA